MRRREVEPEGESGCFLTAEDEEIIGDDDEFVAPIAAPPDDDDDDAPPPAAAAATVAAAAAAADVASNREGLWVRSCCFMLSLRVKALLQVGQWMFFSPVCFLPCRAAWPEVVNVSWHAYRAACGHGYFFLTGLMAESVGVVTAEVEVPDGGITGVDRALGGERVMAGSWEGYESRVCSG